MGKFNFLIFMIIFIVGFIIIHELIHAQIFDYFGCENVKFGVNNVMFYTYCEDGYIDNDFMWLAHSINEIVGYSLFWFFAMFFTISTRWFK